MIELYHATMSTCAQKVRMVLAEKRLDWEGHVLDLRASDQHQPDYLKLNPNGVVPTLVNAGQVVIESTVICEYLDDVFPAVRMLPENPAERAFVRAWGRYLDEVPTAAIRVPSFNMAFLPRFDDLDDAAFQKQQANVRPIRKRFYEKMGRKGFDDIEVDAAMDQFNATLNRMEQRLGEATWLSGDTFGLADIIVLPLVDRMEDLNFTAMWEDHFSRVTDWFERSKARASFDAAFYPKSRLSEFLEIAPLRRGA